jgi:peroxiredoxin Q/BCP
MNKDDLVHSDECVATNGVLTLQQYRGQWVVLYFYPKDATSGCTIEAQAFRDHYSQLLAYNAVVLGVSRDSLKSHHNFKAKQNLPFELISDENEALCNQFAVMKMKSMYGKQYLGIERSTFLIDPNGVVRSVWRNVKVKGHLEEVLSALKGIN